MSTKIVHTENALRPGGAYSQGVVANGFLFTSGMGPHDPATRQVVGDSIEEQTSQTMRNVAAVLATQGLNWSDVVKATVHLSDFDRDFKGFDEVYREVTNPTHPARTTVGSQLSGMLVEIDVVAALRTEDQQGQG